MTAPATHTPAAAAPATPPAPSGLPYFAAPLGVLVAQVAAELLAELRHAGLAPLTPPPRHRRPVTVDVTVDRDAEGELFWRATLRLNASGWIEHYEPLDPTRRPHQLAPITLFDTPGTTP